MVIYVPGTEETDQKKQNMSLQQMGAAITTINAGYVVGPGSATDNAAARFDATTGKLVQDSPLIIADTTGALSRSGGGGIPIQGRNTNTPASAGDVGEIIRSVVTLSPGFSLTSGSAGQVWNSISLTAGVWLVGCQSGVFGSAGCTFTHMHADFGDSTTSIQTSPGDGTTTALHLTSNQSNGWIFPNGIKPFFLSAGTTINAVMTADFSGGTAVAYGTLWALRIC
jgi:hypothetical protein